MIAQVTRDSMPETVVLSRPWGEPSSFDQLANNRMILGKLSHCPLMEEIRPAISSMRKMDGIALAESQRHRCPHTIKVWIGRSFGTDLLVGAADTFP
jgi:hypothetical protein